MSNNTNNYSENCLLLKWILRRSKYTLTAKHYFSKILRKIILNQAKWDLSNYPGEISKLVPSPDDSKKARWVLPSKEGTGQDTAFKGVSRITLAGKTLDVSTGVGINWTERFNDSEDEESLHRWNWALTLLSERKDEIGYLVPWVSSQFEKWFDLFLPDIKNNNCDSFKWESYTAGERISNTVLFYCLTKTAPSEKIIEGIRELAEFLAYRLEYKGAATGNHVLNNARALYLAGTALDIHEWRSFGAAVIKRELPILVTKDGFLREGSSHYQFLFTRWMLEVHHFAQLSGDKDMITDLSPVISGLVDKCGFFLVHKEASGEWDIPLFGDISPDFRPGWLLGLTGSELARPFLDELAEETPEEKASGWAGMFGPVRRIERRREGTASFPESGWFRFDHLDQTLFLRFDPWSAPGHAGHHHNDMFHFCLYYKGEPVLVDAGRRNYMTGDEWGDFGLRPEAHNAFLIDGLGAVPHPTSRYPAEYVRSQNNISHAVTVEDVLEITLRSSAFERLRPPVKVKRTFYLSARGFVFEDNFEGAGRHSVSTYLHWDRAVKITDAGPDAWGLSTDSCRGRLDMEISSPYKLNVYRGGEAPAGWMVRKYGRAVESTVIEIKTEMNERYKAAYSIDWDR